MVLILKFIKKINKMLELKEKNSPQITINKIIRLAVYKAALIYFINEREFNPLNKQLGLCKSMLNVINSYPSYIEKFTEFMEFKPKVNTPTPYFWWPMTEEGHKRREECLIYCIEQIEKEYELKEKYNKNPVKKEYYYKTSDIIANNLLKKLRNTQFKNPNT
jgi:hypothetical protein